MAEATSKPADKAFWLLLAQNWQTLVEDMEAEPSEERKQIQQKSV